MFEEVHAVVALLRNNRVLGRLGRGSTSPDRTRCSDRRVAAAPGRARLRRAAAGGHVVAHLVDMEEAEGLERRHLVGSKAAVIDRVEDT